MSDFEVALSDNDGGLVFRQSSSGKRTARVVTVDEFVLVLTFRTLLDPEDHQGNRMRSGTETFSDSQLVWAETKYDSERAQIHVKVDQDTGSAELKIFSKSKRESTNDRHAIHQ